MEEFGGHVGENNALGLKNVKQMLKNIKTSVKRQFCNVSSCRSITSRCYVLKRNVKDISATSVLDILKFPSVKKKHRGEPKINKNISAKLVSYTRNEIKMNKM